MAKTILCILALAVASFAAPVDEAVQVPGNTHVVGQVNVKPGLLSIPTAPITVQDKQEQPLQQEQQQQQQQQEIQQAIQQQAVLDDQVQQEPLVPIGVAPIGEIQGGGEGAPDLGVESPDGDKSDLDTANTFWGFGRRHWGGGWGGGWGGYYRPYYGGYYRGHGGYGHGWGRGYGGGWGGYWG